MSHIAIQRIKESSQPSNGNFTFGNSNYKSLKTINIPCQINKRNFKIKTEVVDGDIPWLIGKDTMARMGMIIHIEEKMATISKLHTQISLQENIRGHFKINLIAMPLAYTFNEVLAMDVGEIEEKKFLVMIDMATRYCQATFIRNKNPDEIVKGVLPNKMDIFFWIA